MYTWDWATQVPELLSDGDARYLVGHDTLGWTDGAAWTYALPDALGSVRQEVDAAGALIAARAWSSYGIPRRSQGKVGGAQRAHCATPAGDLLRSIAHPPF